MNGEPTTGARCIARLLDSDGGRLLLAIGAVLLCSAWPVLAAPIDTAALGLAVAPGASIPRAVRTPPARETVSPHIGARPVRASTVTPQGRGASGQARTAWPETARREATSSAATHANST